MVTKWYTNQKVSQKLKYLHTKFWSRQYLSIDQKKKFATPITLKSVYRR